MAVPLAVPLAVSNIDWPHSDRLAANAGWREACTDDLLFRILSKELLWLSLSAGHHGRCFGGIHHSAGLLAAGPPLQHLGRLDLGRTARLGRLLPFCPALRGHDLLRMVGFRGL